MNKKDKHRQERKEFRERKYGYDLSNNHLGGAHIDGDPKTFMPDIWEHIIDVYNIKSVVDIGCGYGKNLEWFRDKGEILGIEGHLETFNSINNNFPVILHDYSTGPLTLKKVYDLCLCTEFVEHVESIFEQHWFETMKSCKYVLMCHGLPGQPGHHHVNNQESEYWANRFLENNFILDDEKTKIFRETGKHSRYGRNTLMFYVNKLHKV